MIQINNLDFGYHKTQVFQNISLEFKAGTIYGLLGENGVGKTTLLKLICGLLRPQQGTCTIDDLNSFERQPQMLQDVCLLTDEFEVPSARKMSPAKYFKSLLPFYPKADMDTFLSLMVELEVDPNRNFREMSFGQQKKSMIAISMALNTRYLLLDEPTNGLDIPSKSGFRSILSKRINEDSTIIISTHQVKDVENLIDPIIILTQDAVLLNATTQRITEKLTFSYDSSAKLEALFSEPRPGGCLNVCINTDGSESEVDIEALFNTVLRNSSKIKSLFTE